jgi:hypothetical protein
MPDLLDPPKPEPVGPPDGCLGCARLEDPACATVVLLTGATVCSWCPAWKAETFDRQQEAYAVLAMANKPTRVAHLDAREAAFGPEYRRRLEATILETWERRRAAASGPDHA